MGHGLALAGRPDVGRRLWPASDRWHAASRTRRRRRGSLTAKRSVATPSPDTSRGVTLPRVAGCCPQGGGSFRSGAGGGRPETSRAAGAAGVVLRPDTDVAASRKVRIGAAQRAVEAERVDDLPACRGPHAGPDAAAAQPRGLGHIRRDEPGPPVRGGGPGCGRTAQPPTGRNGDRRDR